MGEREERTGSNGKLVADPYLFETTFDVRSADYDLMGHVNHVAYVTYLEEARERYLETVIGKGLRNEPNTVTAHLEIEYIEPIQPEHEHVTVGIRPGELGTTSIPLECEIRVDGNVVASGETVQVVYSAGAEKSIEIPKLWRQRIQNHRRDND